MSAIITYSHLETRQKSAYRQLFIKGTRIRAEIIYRAHINVEEPRTEQQLAVDYNLPVEAVREAIAYCRSNPPELRDDLTREEAIMAASGESDPDYKYTGKPKLLSTQQWAELLD
jgi:uncharacterized protein (DUF433 family)